MLEFFQEIGAVTYIVPIVLIGAYLFLSFYGEGRNRDDDD